MTDVDSRRPPGPRPARPHRALALLSALALACAGCGASDPGTSASPEPVVEQAAYTPVPEVVVHAPNGWAPQSAHWSVNRDEETGFAFMDRSYGTSRPGLEDASVYVCVESTEQSACPSDSPYVISLREVGRYRVSVSQERRKDGPRNREAEQVWGTATVDVR